MPMVKTGENAYKILLALSEGDKRFHELVQEVKKASLAKELTILERQKYIKRTVSDSKPPTTTYSLTKVGRQFLEYKAKELLPKLESELQRLKGIMPDKIKNLKESL